MVGLYSDIPGSASFANIDPPKIVNSNRSSQILETEDTQTAASSPETDYGCAINPKQPSPTCDDLDLDFDFNPNRNISISDMPTTIAKIVFFLPWTVLVGASILLFPHQMGKLAFSTGFVSAPPGIRRFGHWADTAVPHVMTFLASILVLGYWVISPALGIAVCAGVVGGTFFAWQGFTLDLGKELGEDDMQSVWLVVVKNCFEDEGLGMRKTSKGYHFEAKANDLSEMKVQEQKKHGGGSLDSE
jgi:hypothetical protein